MPVCAPPLATAERTAARSSRRSRSRSSGDSSATERPGKDAGLPQDLIGEQVAHAGNRPLVEQPRLDRRVADADQTPKVIAVDERCVGPDVAEVGVQHRATETTLVAEGKPGPVLEFDGKAVPAGRTILLLENDSSSHPEVQPERGTFHGLQPEELAPAMGAGQLMADQRFGYLAGRVGPAHVGVAVIDARDPPVKDGLEGLARAFGLR